MQGIFYRKRQKSFRFGVYVAPTAIAAKQQYIPIAVVRIRRRLIVSEISNFVYYKYRCQRKMCRTLRTLPPDVRPSGKIKHTAVNASARNGGVCVFSRPDGMSGAVGRNRMSRCAAGRKHRCPSYAAGTLMNAWPGSISSRIRRMISGSGPSISSAFDTSTSKPVFSCTISGDENG